MPPDIGLGRSPGRWHQRIFAPGRSDCPGRGRKPFPVCGEGGARRLRAAVAPQVGLLRQRRCAERLFGKSAAEGRREIFGAPAGENAGSMPRIGPNSRRPGRQKDPAGRPVRLFKQSLKPRRWLGIGDAAPPALPEHDPGRGGNPLPLAEEGLGGDRQPIGRLLPAGREWACGDGFHCAIPPPPRPSRKRERGANGVRVVVDPQVLLFRQGRRAGTAPAAEDRRHRNGQAPAGVRSRPAEQPGDSAGGQSSSAAAPGPVSAAAGSGRGRSPRRPRWRRR